jgi:hypothetical protein
MTQLIFFATSSSCPVLAKRRNTMLAITRNDTYEEEKK